MEELKNEIRKTVVAAVDSIPAGSVPVIFTEPHLVKDVYEATRHYFRRNNRQVFILENDIKLSIAQRPLEELEKIKDLCEQAINLLINDQITNESSNGNHSDD